MMMWSRHLAMLGSASLLLILLVWPASAGPLRAEEGGQKKVKKTKPEVEGYLRKYMKLGAQLSSGRPFTDEEFRESIKAFQRNAGIDVTGEIDEKTQELMNKPRCGVKDAPDQTGKNGRHKRFATLGLQWPYNVLTYQISGYTPDMNPSDVDTVIADAAQAWAAASALEITRDQVNPVDIAVKFATRYHGDDVVFDGPEGTLAHANMSPVSHVRGSTYGDVHFDEDETWSHLEEQGATDLPQVALHELGHSLGLAHSSDSNAIMYAYYVGWKPNVQLTQDDIDGIRSIYGPP